LAGSRVVAEARQLLADGRKEKARDLLLKAGFGKALDAEAQQAYVELFPVTPALQERLDGVLRRLGDEDPAVRRKASGELARTALSESSIYTEEWVKDPRTTEPLLAALNDPSDAVVENVTIALAVFVRRYFPDLRAVPALLPVLQSKKENTRAWAAEAIGILDGKRRLEALLPLLQDRSALVRRRVLTVLIGFSARLPAASRRLLLEPAVRLLRDKDPQVRAGAASVLRELGDRTALKALEEALTSEKQALTRERVEMAIEVLRKRPG
jgi:HEAT repeat protein